MMDRGLGTIDFVADVRRRWLSASGARSRTHALASRGFKPARVKRNCAIAIEPSRHAEARRERGGGAPGGRSGGGALRAQRVAAVGALRAPPAPATTATRWRKRASEADVVDDDADADGGEGGDDVEAAGEGERLDAPGADAPLALVGRSAAAARAHARFTGDKFDTVELSGEGADGEEIKMKAVRPLWPMDDSLLEKDGGLFDITEQATRWIGTANIANARSSATGRRRRCTSCTLRIRKRGTSPRSRSSTRFVSSA